MAIEFSVASDINMKVCSCIRNALVPYIGRATGGALAPKQHTAPPPSRKSEYSQTLSKVNIPKVNSTVWSVQNYASLLKTILSLLQLTSVKLISFLSYLMQRSIDTISLSL